MRLNKTLYEGLVCIFFVSAVSCKTASEATDRNKSATTATAQVATASTDTAITQTKTEKKVISYIKKHDGLYNALYVTTSENNLKRFIQYNQAIPTIKVYNNSLNIANLSNGSASMAITVQSFENAIRLMTRNGAGSTLDSDYYRTMKYLALIDGSDQFLTDKDFDLLVVYDWAQSSPKFAKDMFEALHQIERIKKPTSVRVKFISINLDPQDNWTK